MSEIKNKETEILEQLTQKIFKDFISSDFSQESPVETFFTALTLHSKVFLALAKAYEAGYESGYEQGVNVSIKIKQN